ncbi:hypothetical protein M378DRAFT_105741 [Amanita muscaria Koide BX008]|uniref:Oxidoreductase-like domain-containing protein n=1 Tax=Amanita muscaria (strain Koide BX008) TaxID=946122 RepID=A0A0C2WSP1_AMAMK|nr:hypothetical protein M378DRAFT_105741 [Amanita muscaria Koide BX008]
MVANPKPRDAVIMFRGLEIPKEPQTPGSDECCMSGCAVCVYDLYEEAIERYRENIEEVKVKLRAMGAEEREWPGVLIGKSVGHGGKGKEGEDRNAKSVVMDAFEALERELQAKKIRSEVGDRAQGSPGNGAQIGGRPDGTSSNSLSAMRDVSEAVGWVIFGNR